MKKRKKYLKLPWQKNFRKIPVNILKKVEEFGEEKIIVGSVKKIPITDIKSARYKHLEIYYEDNKLIFPEKIIPTRRTGKFSHKNINGYIIVRKDLPKITKIYTFEVPNYGDWHNGSHDVDIPREVYPRDFISPKEVAIKIELIGKEFKTEENVILKFTVEEIINPQSQNFKETLFFNLNLLQENIGSVDIYKSNATVDEFLKTIYVSWEILPPGEKDENIATIFTAFNAENEKLKETIQDRYNFLNSLNPKAFIAGRNEFRRYFGAKFSDNLVVFENIEYGNAIYIMYENWQELSKLSRIDLLNMKEKKFERIIHKNNWKRKLKNLINIQKRN